MAKQGKISFQTIANIPIELQTAFEEEVQATEKTRKILRKSQLKIGFL